MLSNSGVTSEEADTLTGALLSFGDGLDSGSGLVLTVSVVFINLEVSHGETVIGEEPLVSVNVEETGEAGVRTGDDSMAETEDVLSTEAMPALDTCSGPMLRTPVSSEG